MRTVSVRSADLPKVTIPIGYVGENLYTKVIIDCKKDFDEHPTAVVGMSVQPPEGDAYPAIVTRDGDFVVWEVSASDLVYKGSGSIQISFTVDGTIVGKTPVGRIMVNKSIVPDGEAPEALDDFLTRASTALNEIPEDIAEALAEAKASGEFDGADGYSPTVTVTTITGGHQITITDAEGDHIFTVMDGQDGQDGQPGTPGQDGHDGTDGVSPTVSVTDITGGHKVTITDAEGTHEFNVMDGTSGAQIDDESTAANKVWSASKTNELKSAIQQKYTLPSGGIPSTDLASGVQTSLGKADTAYQKPNDGIPLSDLASNVTTVSGSTPSITGVAGFQYICGECSTLSIAVPSSGCIDVVFESGSTATVLTVTPTKTGVSAIKWANGFDPTSLEANTTYEINILDGELGVGCSWT